MEMDSGIPLVANSESEAPPQLLPERRAARGARLVATALVASAGAVAATAAFAGARSSSPIAASLGANGTVKLGGTDLHAGKGCYGTPYWSCRDVAHDSSLIIDKKHVTGDPTLCRKLCEQTTDCDSFMMHLAFLTVFPTHWSGCLADAGNGDLADSTQGNCHLFKKSTTPALGPTLGILHDFWDDTMCLTLSTTWKLEPCANAYDGQIYKETVKAGKYTWNDKVQTKQNQVVVVRELETGGRVCTATDIREKPGEDLDCYLLKQSCIDGFVEEKCWANIYFKGDNCDYTTVTTTTTTDTTTTDSTTTASTETITITTTTVKGAGTTPSTTTKTSGSECIAHWRHGCRNWEDIEIPTTKTASSASECHQRCRNTQNCVEFNFQPGSCTGSVYDCSNKGTCMLFKGACDFAPNAFWDHYTMTTPCPPVERCLPNNNKCKLKNTRTGCDNWDQIRIDPEVTVSDADACCDVCERNANCVGFNFQEAPCTSNECAATGTCMIFSGKCDPKETNDAWDHYIRDDTCR